MVRCVLSQLKSSELYIISCEKGLGLYPIQKCATEVGYMYLAYANRYCLSHILQHKFQVTTNWFPDIVLISFLS